MAVPHQTQSLAGWGGHPRTDCRVYRPERRAELRVLVSHLSSRSGDAGETGRRDAGDAGRSDAGDAGRGDAGATFVSRGLGRSYGDAALNAEGVVSHLALARMLAWDEAAGVLECEAGVSLGDVIDTFLPRGFLPPVLPGTRFVTVGGAVAADVHGKSHVRDGTFTRHVESLRVVSPADGEVVCSAEENADLFHATAGGMGMTGAIVSARIRLRRVPSAAIRAEHRAAPHLPALMAALAEADARHPYTVAWLDAAAGGARLGRGVVSAGGHATVEEAARAAPARTRSLAVPSYLPGAAPGRLAMPALNALVHARAAGGREEVVDVRRFFHPLDHVLHWNRLYGRAGFAQVQLVVPPEGAEAALGDLLRTARAAGHLAFLAVLKRTGPEGPGLLSFPREGWTLALDFPVRAGLGEMVHALHRRAIQAGGRAYLAKDAFLDAGEMRAMYPRLDAFRSVRRRVDPRGVLSSSLARRVGIV